jgi:cellulose synthase/poly-beta-1,6-N-acetylglucosamine synthase-like glycosyltransferase
VSIVQRRQPDARLGKGAALNAGFREILAEVHRRGLDPRRVIVCVMDADGRLSDGAVHEVLPLFEDIDVGGVQLAVRIRNRDGNFLLQFQDHQFWTLSSLTQFGRMRTGTVSLGGNGQFTRLAALLDVGDQPWSESLTEDLDLAISLGLRGWTLTSTPRAAVDQQGVERLGALIRQRTRWYQGHMLSARRLPEVLRSPEMHHGASLEMTLYLLVPWMLDLPWSILYHLVCLEVVLRVSQTPIFGGGPASQLGALVGIYVLGFWPALVTALMAKARDPSITWGRAVKLGHAFIVTNYLSYACAWSAVLRILRSQHGWTKTDRVEERAIAAAGAR